MPAPSLKALLQWAPCLLPSLLLAQPARPLFTQMSPKQTGIHFLNKIEEDDSLNVMRYEYLYNGAGVGVADLNNDGLNDIFLSSNTGPCKLYLNKGNFAFQDVTKQAQVAGNGTWCTGVSIADVNGDGLMDIYVCHSGKYADSMQLSHQLFICQGGAGRERDTGSKVAPERGGIEDWPSLNAAVHLSRQPCSARIKLWRGQIGMEAPDHHSRLRRRF